MPPEPQIMDEGLAFFKTLQARLNAQVADGNYDKAQATMVVMYQLLNYWIQSKN